MRKTARVAIPVLAMLLPWTGGCLYIAFPADIHAGPGRHLVIVDAETQQPIRDARVLLEHYVVEGAMHAGPVIRLERLEVLTPTPQGGYRLASCVRWQQTWVVWMPTVKHSPVRAVAGVKVFAPGYETVWFPVAGPLDGVRLGREGAEPALYLRPLKTPAEREAALDAVARFGWPPGSKTALADVMVPPAVHALVAPLLIERYERLLADFPDYQDAARVRAAIERWKKAM